MTTERTYHPVADLLPSMGDDEFEQLKADIAANGLRESIWLHPDGRILDGRHRYRACRELGIEPHYRTWDGRESVVALVVSLNLHRRHMTSSQYAATAVKAKEMDEMLAREAHERRTAQLRRGDESPVDQIVDQRGSGRVNDQLADVFQTNRQYVSDARRLADEAPDLFEAVHKGRMTIPQAKREAVARTRAETPPLPDGRYRVIYADPPWQYGNSGVINDGDNYGRAARHYPTMSIDELSALPVRELAADHAVLFLWVTSPLLEECFPVIRAWGFAYKTSFVWDKVRHNFGHYNSVRHELLLVCTRGSCTPDAAELVDSVQTIERSAIHSQKPEAFRQIIDRLYTHGKRIELFARPGGAPPAGWDTWGNEPTREP